MAGQRPFFTAIITLVITQAVVECPRPGPVAREARGRPCAGRTTELARPHSRSEPCRTRLRAASRSLRLAGRRRPRSRRRGRGRGRTREGHQTQPRRGRGRGGKPKDQGPGRRRNRGRAPSSVGGQPGGRARSSGRGLSRSSAGVGHRKMAVPGTAIGRPRHCGQATDIGRRTGTVRKTGITRKTGIGRRRPGGQGTAGGDLIRDQSIPVPLPCLTLIRFRDPPGRMKPGHFARRAPIIRPIRRPPARRRPRLRPPLENVPRKG